MEYTSENIEDLTVEDLVILIKEMRFNQRRFKRTGKAEIQNTLEPLESKIDELVILYFERQQKLF